jgi:hypothetical protein
MTSARPETCFWPVVLHDRDDAEFCYRDVNGAVVSFHDFDRDPELTRDIYLTLAKLTLVNAMEISDIMGKVIEDLLGPEHEGSVWNRLMEEHKRNGEEAKQFSTLLKLPLPIDEAHRIWARSCDHLRLSAMLMPDKESRELLAEVARSEERMEAMFSAHCREYEQRKRKLA